MSESEQDEVIKTPFQVALNRITLGIAFGATVIGILFSVWGMTIDRGGPIIGVFVFQLLTLAAIMVVSVNIILKKVIQCADDQRRNSGEI